MTRREARFSGFGGQGIILSGFIVGKAATIFDGKYATLTQNYGPESRGGACTANIIVSDDPVLFPHVVQPSVQVLFSQEAYNKYGNVSDDCVLLIDEDLVKPTANGTPKSNIYSIPATRIAEELGRKIIANIVMLGFFTAIAEVVSEKSMIEAILSSVPKGTEQLNLEAFQRGYKYGKERKTPVKQSLS